jgi:hypothetical protein
MIKTKYNIIGIFSVMIILLIIWNKLRNRQPYNLFNEFNLFVQISLKVVCLWLVSIILLKTYMIFFANSVQIDNTNVNTIMMKIKNLYNI